MLHYVQRAIDPHVRLKKVVEDWFAISCMLREGPRKRALKTEAL